MERPTFKLSLEQKQQLKNASEWANPSDVEEVCRDFLFMQEFMKGRPSKKEIMADLNDMTAKLKTCLTANLELMKTIDNSNPWMPCIKKNTPMFDRLKKINGELLQRIKMIETFDYPTNKNQQSLPEYFLLFGLFDLYFKATGREATRINPTDTDPDHSEQSPIADIIKILEPSLNCGPCTGLIPKVIRTRKERNYANSST